MSSFVTLRWDGVDPPEEHKLLLYEGGRLDWATVEKAFRASQVQLLVEGEAFPLDVYPPSHERGGLTRSTFEPGETYKVEVDKLAFKDGGGSLASERARHSAKYVGRTSNHEPVTAFGEHWLVTHAHGDNLSWNVGTVMKLWVNHEGSDTRRQIDATVKYKSSNGTDYVLLHTSASLQYPEPDNSTPPCDRCILIGCSVRSQKGHGSVRHGVVSTSVPDQNGHIRCDFQSAGGDSGGGCFLTATGKLFGINVGFEHGTRTSVVLPIVIPIAKVKELEHKVP